MQTLGTAFDIMFWLSILTGIIGFVVMMNKPEIETPSRETSGIETSIPSTESLSSGRI